MSVATDRDRLLAFLRVVGADNLDAVYDNAPALLQMIPPDLADLADVDLKVMDRETVRDRVYAGVARPRAERLVTALGALTMVVRQEWESPLLPLLLFCTGWTEERARDAAAALDVEGVELSPPARVWLDTICRKSVARN